MNELKRFVKETYNSLEKILEESKGFDNDEIELLLFKLLILLRKILKAIKDEEEEGK